MGNAQWTSLKVVILIAFQADAWIVRESFVDRDIWAILKRKDRPWVSYVARKTLYFWNSCPMSLCYCALHTPPCPSTTRFIRSSAMLFSLKWSKVKSLSRIRLFVIPLTVAYQVPLPVEFCRQEYWHGLPCPSPGDLPYPGTELRSPVLQADFLPSQHKAGYYGTLRGKHRQNIVWCKSQQDHFWFTS